MSTHGPGCPFPTAAAALASYFSLVKPLEMSALRLSSGSSGPTCVFFRSTWEAGDRDGFQITREMTGVVRN